MSDADSMTPPALPPNAAGNGPAMPGMQGTPATTTIGGKRVSGIDDPNSPAIEVRGLTKIYGPLKALDNMTFTVPRGVIAGFVGPNGSGKTTTMRILATLLKPDTGTARVFGMDLLSTLSASRVRHSIGFMPDYFGLYNDMTSGEYLDFFAAAYRIPIRKRETLVDDILAIIGLSEKKDTIIAGLSRGMQQRLSLGRCLVHSPQLLLLDEPASGLDPRARIELMELLKELKKMGKTILISSHILSELHQLCDMVVIIEKGKLIYSGTVRDASLHMSEGKTYMELTVQGDSTAIAAQITAGLTEVKEARVQGQEIYVEYLAPLTSADIIDWCVANGIRLDEARRGEARLEEIFMSLTAGD